MKNSINHSLKTEIIPLIILLLTFSLSLWAYPKLPTLVASHWGISGQVNGWSSREFQSLFLPGLLIALYLMFRVLPKLDPLGARYQEFAGVYLMMRNAILSFLFIIFAATTFFNLGYTIDIGVIILGSVGLLMILLGSSFKKIKRNFFVGIRTPWTLSSDYVWDKTHKLGSYLFMIWGAGLIITPWLTQILAFWVLIGGIVIIVSSLMVYSYLLYKQEKNQINK